MAMQTRFTMTVPSFEGRVGAVRLPRQHLPAPAVSASSVRPDTGISLTVASASVQLSTRAQAANWSERPSSGEEDAVPSLLPSAISDPAVDDLANPVDGGDVYRRAYAAQGESHPSQAERLAQAQAQQAERQAEQQWAEEDAQQLQAEHKLREADEARALETATQLMNKMMAQYNHALRFELDKDTQRRIVQVIDRQTNEVVVKLPPDEMLAAARAIRRQEQEGNPPSSGTLLREQA